jgi:hypothetical protein
MAKETSGPDRPVEMIVLYLVSGGKVPSRPIPIPRDGRLKEESIMFDEICNSLGPGSERELNFNLILNDDSALSVSFGLAMKHAAVAIHRRVLKTAGLEKRLRAPSRVHNRLR